MKFLWRTFGLTIGFLALAFGVTSASASVAKPKVTCSIASGTGQLTIPLVDQGVDRPFLLYVPTSYDSHHRLPLLLNLHPSGSNGTAQMNLSAMAAVAESQGVAVAAPNGAVSQGPTTNYWNVPGVPLVTGSFAPAGTPDDERYLLRVIRTAKKSLCIDSNRISVTGYSGGARMSSQMACDHSGVIASVSPVAGLRAGVPKETSPDVWAPDGPTCRPAKQVAIQAFHGTADTTNPFLGNDDPRWGYSVESALARWTKLDRCRRTKSTQVTATVTRILSDRCSPGSTVRLYRQEGAGHTWPGSPVDVGAGLTDHSINASRMIVKFAKTNSLANRKRPKRKPAKR